MLSSQTSAQGAVAMRIWTFGAREHLHCQAMVQNNRESPLDEDSERSTKEWIN